MRLQRRLPSASWLGTTTCARPAGPRSRSAPSSLPSAPRPPIPPSAAGWSPALCPCTRATPATSTRPAANPAGGADPRAPAEHDLTGCRLEREPQPPHQRCPTSAGSTVVPNISGLASHREGAVVDSSLEATEGLVTELPKEDLACRSHVRCCPLSSGTNRRTTDHRRTSRARASISTRRQDRRSTRW
jgi:hypothetical protein